MPLFKKHHNEPTSAQDASNNNPNTELNQPIGPGPYGVTGSASGAGAPSAAAAGFGQDQPGGMGYPQGAGGHHPQQDFGNNSNTNDPYSHAGNNNDPNLPPTNHFGSGHHSGGGSRMTGKLEHAIGSLVGSQALKSKGIQKEQEAAAFKMQSSELAEAERLEREALLRRERAVQHGAHPANRNLGGIQAEDQHQDFYGGGPMGNSGGGPTGPQGAGGAQGY